MVRYVVVQAGKSLAYIRVWKDLWILRPRWILGVFVQCVWGGRTCLLKSYKLFFWGPLEKMEPTFDEVWHIFCFDSVLG